MLLCVDIVFIFDNKGTIVFWLFKNQIFYMKNNPKKTDKKKLCFSHFWLMSSHHKIGLLFANNCSNSGDELFFKNAEFKCPVPPSKKIYIYPWKFSKSFHFFIVKKSRSSRFLEIFIVESSKMNPFSQLTCALIILAISFATIVASQKIIQSKFDFFMWQKCLL